MTSSKKWVRLLIRVLLRIAFRVYYRSIQVQGAESIPEDGASVETDSIRLGCPQPAKIIAKAGSRKATLNQD